MTSSTPRTTHDYLAQRLDGARDLYLLALALGERSSGHGSFGALILEARIHFAGVIEEARIAGLDTSAIAGVLVSKDLADGIRPEMWKRVEEILAQRPRRKKKAI
jgi:hypothetical protein